MVCIASSFVRQQLIYECHALVIRGRFISRQITTRHYYFLSRHCFSAAVVATTLICLRTVQRTTPSYVFNHQRGSQDLFLLRSLLLSSSLHGFSSVQFFCASASLGSLHHIVSSLSRDVHRGTSLSLVTLAKGFPLV